MRFELNSIATDGDGVKNSSNNNNNNNNSDNNHTAKTDNEDGRTIGRGSKEDGDKEKEVEDAVAVESPVDAGPQALPEDEEGGEPSPESLIDDHGDVKLHFRTFLEQSIVQLFYPWTLPYMLIRYGRIMAANMALIPCSAAWRNPLEVFGWLLVPAMAHVILILAIICPINQALFVETFLALGLFTAHRLVVGLKYGYQKAAFYRMLQKKLIPTKQLLQIELLSGWIKPSPDTIERQLRVASQILGVDLDKMYFIIKASKLKAIRNDDTDTFVNIVNSCTKAESASCQLTNGFLRVKGNVLAPMLIQRLVANDSIGKESWIFAFIQPVLYFSVIAAVNPKILIHPPWYEIVIHVCATILGSFFFFVWAGFLSTAILDYQRRYRLFRTLGSIIDPFATWINEDLLEKVEALNEQKSDVTEKSKTNSNTKSTSSGNTSEPGSPKKKKWLRKRKKTTVVRHTFNPSSALIDFTFPVNVTSWFSLRELFHTVGCHYRKRLEAYTSCVVVLNIGLLGLLLWSWFNPDPAGRRSVTTVLVSALVGYNIFVCGLYLARMMYVGSQANEQYLVHKATIHRIILSINHLATCVANNCEMVPVENEEGRTWNPEVLRQSSELLSNALDCLADEDLRNPIRVLGVRASLAVVTASLAATLTGLSSLFRLIST